MDLINTGQFPGSLPASSRKGWPVQAKTKRTDGWLHDIFYSAVLANHLKECVDKHCSLHHSAPQFPALKSTQWLLQESSSKRTAPLSKTFGLSMC